MATASELAATVRRVAKIATTSRASRITAQRAAVGRLARVARESFNARAETALAGLREELAVYDAHGAPPPLLRLAHRSAEEKPYNAYLGWLCNPTREHRAALPVLKAIAELVAFDELAVEVDTAGLDIEVRCEMIWPPGARSSREPDLLVLAPRERPRAILLLENKVRSGEGVGQYDAYHRALNALARHHGVPLERCRAFLLAPDDRGTPAHWHGVVRHGDLAAVLQRLSENAMIPRWDRVLCYFIAEAFLHGDSAANKVAASRELMRRLSGMARPTVADLRRITELLPFPEPFNWTPNP